MKSALLLLLSAVALVTSQRTTTPIVHISSIDASLGTIRCATNMAIFEQIDRTVTQLAFGSVTPKHKVERVVINRRFNNPLCYAAPHGGLHSINLYYTECGVIPETIGTLLKYEFDVFTDVRHVLNPVWFIQRNYTQKFTCSANLIDTPDLEPQRLGLITIELADFPGEFDIPLRAKSTTEILPSFTAEDGSVISNGDVQVVRLEFDIAAPADRERFNIFIDSCTVSTSADGANAIPFIHSRGQMDPDFAQMAKLTQPQSPPAPYSTATVEFLALSNSLDAPQEMHFNCKINICQRHGFQNNCKTGTGNKNAVVPAKVASQLWERVVDNVPARFNLIRNPNGQLTVVRL